MRFVPTIVHGAADYVVALAVFLLPFFFQIEGSARWALFALGALVAIYSLATDYELGAVRFLRVRFHLFLDMLFAAAMLALPWLFDLPPGGARPVIYTIALLALVLVATTKVRALGTAAPR